MNNEIITLNEVANDGNFVHLYYNEEIGFYVAYGLSAYLICRVIDPICSYSEKFQMPVVLLNQEQIQQCRISLQKVKHSQHSYYQFQMAITLPMSEDYINWAANLKKICV